MRNLANAPIELEFSATDPEEKCKFAIKTRRGIAKFKERTAKRVVTTGCGQGSVFGGLMDEVDSIHLPDARITQAQLYAIVNADSLDAAARTFRNHPHLGIPQSSIEVMELKSHEM